MVAFATRGSSNQLPLRILHLQQQLRLQRNAVVMEARKDPDMMDQPFTFRKLHKAKKGRETANREDGVTYPILANTGPAGDAALLALLSTSWLVG